MAWHYLGDTGQRQADNTPVKIRVRAGAHFEVGPLAVTRSRV
jgi:hypothetical protein